MQNTLKYEGKYPLKIERNVLVYTQRSLSIQPSKIDLRNKCPPVYNQLQLGSCTANALVAAYQFLDLSFFGSRLFLYYNERLLDNDINVDTGSTLTQGIHALQKYGVCDESLWIYSDNPTKFKTKPTPLCYKNGLDHQVIAAKPIAQNLSQMKQCLVDGLPFVFGMMVYESFESINTALTGNIPMPGQNETLLGGHAMLCVGYDDSKSCFIVRNSWGATWGNNGYCYIPYNYLTDVRLAGDFWEITKVEETKNNKKNNNKNNKNNDKNNKNNKNNKKRGMVGIFSLRKKNYDQKKTIINRTQEKKEIKRKVSIKLLSLKDMIKDITKKN
jgi:C1A family cysteine protease